MTRPISKLAHEIARDIRLRGVPFVEVERGKCETCPRTGVEGPRRFARVKDGALGKKRCALCTATNVGNEG